MSSSCSFHLTITQGEDTLRQSTLYNPLPNNINLSGDNPENWTVSQRTRVVKQIFRQVTPRYDLLNHLLSGWRDVSWRRFTARQVSRNSQNVLDLATGTGDLAFDIARTHPSAKVFGIDFVSEMIQVARRKQKRYNPSNNTLFLTAEAMQLPFQDNTFNAVTIAFGFRNIPNRLEALREMRRVLKPGGKVMVLEMTFPENIRMRWFFNWYLNRIIPFIGGVISGSRQAYRYLPNSIQGFLKPSEMRTLFEEVGLNDITEHRLTMGIAYLHIGTNPE